MLRRLLCTCVSALLLVGCHDASHDIESAAAHDAVLSLQDEVEMEPPRTAEPPPPPGLETTATRQRIIYTADARARVANLDSALHLLTERVGRSGGFVSSERRTNAPYRYSAELTLRLPADRLGPTLDYLGDLTEEIDYQNRESTNVTEEWLDLESRLATKREVRDRYIDILRKRAQKVEDILAAEDKIRVITEEIEAKEGRLRYLRDQVKLSTLTLTLYQTIEVRQPGPVATRSFGNKLVGRLGFGLALVENFLLGLVALWPLLLVGVPLGWWAYRKWVK